MVRLATMTTRVCYECGFESKVLGRFVDVSPGLFHCRSLGPCERRSEAARRKYRADLRAKGASRTGRAPGSLFERTANGCLVWRGAKNKNGYGYVRNGARVVYVHRMTFEAAYGPIPASMEVCHRNVAPLCSRSCAEPTHLWLGTHADNMRDMQLKGRAKGVLANATFKTSKSFEAARSSIVDPAWVGATFPQAIAKPIEAPVDADWIDRMVPRYLALGESRPAVIARVLDVPVAAVKDALRRCPQNSGS
jgi:hypothetical protein